MNRNHWRIVLAFIVGAWGVFSLVGVVIAGEEASVFLRGCTVANGVLLLGSAVLLLRNQRVAVLVLLLSAALYAGSIVGPAIAKHAGGAFPNLIPAFYVSVATRVLLAVFAYGLLPVRERNG